MGKSKKSGGINKTKLKVSIEDYDGDDFVYENGHDGDSLEQPPAPAKKINGTTGRPPYVKYILLTLLAIWILLWLIVVCSRVLKILSLTYFEPVPIIKPNIFAESIFGGLDHNQDFGHDGFQGQVDFIHDVQRNEFIGKVPRIIHHLSPSTEVPGDWQQSYQSCVDLHSKEFKTMLWTDELIDEFIESEYPWFLPTFTGYPHKIQRIDTARYFILKHFGGIYMDLDVGCRHCLDKVRELPYANLFPLTSPFGVSNDVIISEADSPFLNYLIGKLLESQNNFVFRFKFFKVMFTTGPAFLSVTLYDYLHESRLQDAPNGSSKKVKVSDLKEIAFISHTDYTHELFYHIRGNSWHGLDAKILLFFYYHYYILILVVAAITAFNWGRLLRCVKWIKKSSLKFRKLNTYKGTRDYALSRTESEQRFIAEDLFI